MTLPVVDDDDVVGQPFGFLEVLGGEDHGGAAVDEGVQHRPQLVAAARVEAGGGLVEEQHFGVADEGGGQVEPTAHSPRVAGHHTVGGVGEGQVVEQLGRPGGRLATGELVQLTEHHEVLPAGEQRVHGGVLGGEADAAADLGGLRIGRRSRRPSPRPRRHR